MHRGRVDANRPASVLSLGSCGPALAGWSLLLLVACAARNAPHPELAAIWRDYGALPEQRALAIAGELRQNLWVAGASGGHALRSDAEWEALRECQRRRKQQRMQAPCRLYAVGNEVVWPGP